MQRRDFLWTLGAATLMRPAIEAAPAFASGFGAAGQPGPGATVLYDGRAIALDRIGPDPGGAAAPKPEAKAGSAELWIQTRDLPRINEFELKPEGACRADICIPVPSTMTRGEYFNLTAFAARIGQRVIADAGARVWSFGEIPVIRGAYLESRLAPDVAVPDRKGSLVRLSQFRGKKVLLVTWASW